MMLERSQNDDKKRNDKMTRKGKQTSTSQEDYDFFPSHPKLRDVDEEKLNFS